MTAKLSWRTNSLRLLNVLVKLMKQFSLCFYIFFLIYLLFWMEDEVLRERVEGINWFHTIDLGDGVITPGQDNSFEKLETLQMPGDLTGKSVLDIGSWDGFFSFEAEKRGAEKILATDSYVWDGRSWGSKEGFLLAREVLGSSVEDKNMDVMDMSPDTLGVFDLVLFLGVLYHLKYPLKALENVASVTGDQLILETFVDLIHIKNPAAAFYQQAELEGDSSSWWAPNPPAVESMLKTAGFKQVKKIYSHPLWFRVGRAMKLRLSNSDSFFNALNQSRVVYHAWK
ncbi:MAG: DUF1698 domain-containing protein [Candidatus Altiarchaeales archaeon]|nr:DUF1698 domain-containing protein [Candidatus Altiarchaeales archaeon]